MINTIERPITEQAPVERPAVIEQAKALLERLSTERLHAVVDYLAYLNDKEAWEATAELEAIPGLLEELKEAEAEVARGEYVRWRDIKDAV